MVTLVKTSPAFVPKALEPPMPPKAPASPPPLPRWIKMRQIRNREVIAKRTLRIPARIATSECPFEGPWRCRISGHSATAKACGCRSGSARAGDELRRLDNRQEVAGLETGAADQGAVDIGTSHE